MSDDSDDLSIGRLAVYSLGAAVAVLVVATTLIAVLQPSAGVSLAIAGVGLLGAVAAMGFVSKWMTRRAYGDDGDPKPGSDA
ncbi:hypothetical protein [Rhodococcus sp. NPDC058521]|uniref:hypothetical protein n=1 Tax=Rhodococcus sp. NPDC058521 TaxID=3346536 RepID=UPI003665A086